jgi:hypothetical protein
VNTKHNDPLKLAALQEHQSVRAHVLSDLLENVTACAGLSPCSSRGRRRNTRRVDSSPGEPRGAAQRGDRSRAALVLALGLLLMVLGLWATPAAAGGPTGHDWPAGHVEFVAQLTQDHVVARLGHHAPLAQSGFWAMPPVAGCVPAGLVKCADPVGFRGECSIADCFARPVRAPPASPA